MIVILEFYCRLLLRDTMLNDDSYSSNWDT